MHMRYLLSECRGVVGSVRAKEACALEACSARLLRVVKHVLAHIIRIRMFRRMRVRPGESVRRLPRVNENMHRKVAVVRQQLLKPTRSGRRCPIAIHFRIVVHMLCACGRPCPRVLYSKSGRTTRRFRDRSYCLSR